MFELRWILRTVLVKNGNDSYHEKVLQMRQWKVRILGDGAVSPLPLPIEWTDWVDVPDIRDEPVEDGAE